MASKPYPYFRVSCRSDQELVERVRQGDLEAFGHLIRRYQGLVFGVAFHVLGNVEDAKDVAQDVFLRAFTRFGQLKEPNRLGSWLRQIAVNECRAQKGRLFETLPLVAELPAPDQLKHADDRLLLAAALRSIDETSRLTVILYYLQAHSIAEIGSFLGEPPTTTKSRLRNARAKLRKEMETVLERNLNQNTLPEDFADRLTQLLEAVSKGDEQKTRELLEADPRLVSVKEEGSWMTPLHIAATSGDTALVELLLAHGADPNALDKGDNASPLHHAAERGRLEAVKLLVEAGADVNWDLDLHQRGPLGWAVVFNPDAKEVAEYLVSKGAKFDIFSATAMGRIDAVRDLVANEPGLLRQRMSRFENFISPIEFATAQRQWEIAELLAELGSDLSLSEVAGLGREELLARRLQEGPQRSILDWALKAAVKANQLATARQLLQKGADPNYRLHTTSLLFDSIGSTEKEMSQLLIEHGADLEFKDSQWSSTPIGWQVFFGQPEQTQLALELGAVVGDHLVGLAESGERGELRRWSAGKAEGYRQVAELLRKHLADRSR